MAKYDIGKENGFLNMPKVRIFQLGNNLDFGGSTFSTSIKGSEAFLACVRRLSTDKIIEASDKESANGLYMISCNERYKL